MRRLLVLFLFFSIACAGFRLESLEVTVSSIQKDGTATVNERIKLIIEGNSSKDLYDSGYAGNNTLAFWSMHTQIKDVKMHVNSGKVVVQNFRLQPQPQSGCNPFLNLCHGELRLSYTASPIIDSTTTGNAETRIVQGTGLFIVEQYKPRTRKYSVNPNAFYFTTTEQGGIILDNNIYFTIILPENSQVLYEEDINPAPTELSGSIPGNVKKLMWNDMVMAKFALTFEVEESLDKEVTEFFTAMLDNFQNMLNSQHGLSLIAIIAIIIGTYIYVNTAKKK